MARLYVGITDHAWYERLGAMPELDELNFWQPSGSRAFRSLQAGGIFLFKLHAPYNAIVGGGFFLQHTVLPLNLAWETFGVKNGVTSEAEMQERVRRYVPTLRNAGPWTLSTHDVGCILLEQPFFFDESQWIPQPLGWARTTQVGKSYDLAESTGQQLFRAVSSRLSGETAAFAEDATERYGTPTLVRRRLGQGSFRVAVTDAYERRCAITGDRVLYVLEAAHIRPYARGGEHTVNNGLLLRSDLHTLFDRGYVAINSDFQVEVSTRLRDQFHNGKEYYQLEGRRILLPSAADDEPDGELLEWHHQRVFDAA